MKPRVTSDRHAGGMSQREERPAMEGRAGHSLQGWITRTAPLTNNQAEA